MNNWFICKVKYSKVDERGSEKKVTEAYLIDAMTYTEAEARLNTNLEEFISGEFVLHAISKANFTDVFPFEDGDIWYKCKVSYVDIDEKSEKEKKVTNYMLVLASNIKDAVDKLDESLSTMIVPYDILSVQDSNIFDIFPYKPSESVEKLENNI